MLSSIGEHRGGGSIPVAMEIVYRVWDDKAGGGTIKVLYGKGSEASDPGEVGGDLAVRLAPGLDPNLLDDHEALHTNDEEGKDRPRPVRPVE